MAEQNGKRKYPEPLKYDEWLRQQNYFLKEQNDSLRQKLNESKEYIEYLVKKLKKFQADI